jgi:tetratricopeptide (TPR) repeat protein/TolB-like protein
MKKLLWIPIVYWFAIIMGATGWSYSATGTEETQHRPSVAVLPFTCAGPSNDLAWAGKALPDLITARLGTEASLDVLDRDFVWSVLAEQGLGANGLITPDSFVGSKLRLADFLVSGEITAGTGEDILSLRIVRSASGALEKTVAIKGKLPKSLGDMVESASAAITGIASGGQLKPEPGDSRLARVPEAVDFYYRGLGWCIQQRPLRAAPYFAEAARRDPGFVLALIRERQCYIQSDLPLLAQEVDTRLKKIAPSLAISTHQPAPNHNTRPALLLNITSASGIDPRIAPEWRTLLESQLAANGITLIGRDALESRTDELDLTLSKRFEARDIPAYRAFAVASWILGVSIRPGNDPGNSFEIGLHLQDSFTGRSLKAWHVPVKSGTTDRIANKIATEVSSLLANGQSETSNETQTNLTSAIGSDWKDPYEVVAANPVENKLDRLGLFLELFAQRPGDLDVFTELSILAYDNFWGAICATIMDKVTPDTYDHARTLFFCASPTLNINGKKSGGLALMPNPSFKADERTLSLFKTIIEKHPNTALAVGAYFRLGLLQLQQTNYTASAENLRLAALNLRLSIDAGQIQSHVVHLDERTFATIAYYRGQAFEKAGLIKEAIDSYQKAFRLMTRNGLQKTCLVDFAWVPDKRGFDMRRDITFLETLVPPALKRCDPHWIDPTPAQGGAKTIPICQLDPNYKTNPIPYEIRGAVLASGTELCRLHGEAAEFAYLKEWADLKDPATTCIQSKDVSFITFVVMPIAKRFKATGHFEEAASLFGKLSHAFDLCYDKKCHNMMRHQNLNSRSTVEGNMRTEAQFQQAQCLDAMNRNAEADQLYKLRIQAHDGDQVYEISQVLIQKGETIRKKEGEAAELAFLMEWASLVDSEKSNSFARFFVLYTAKRLQKSGRYSEAATLFGKLGNGLSLRYLGLFHQAECLEKLNDIDAATRIYKLLIKECSGKGIGGYGIGDLDQVSIKKLEAIRARQEKAEAIRPK